MTTDGKPQYPPHHDSLPPSQSAIDSTSSLPESSKRKATYTDKTQRLQAWSQLLRAAMPYIWGAVILIVIIPLIGRGFIADSFSSNPENSANQPSEVVKVDKTLPSDKLDREIVTAIRDAHTDAERFASERLDEWVDKLMVRVDESFLDWYFNYFNQKKIELSAPLVWLSSTVNYWIDADNPPPKQAVAQKLTEDFQTEFAKRVLRPRTAQLELERMARETVNVYVSRLENDIATIQSSYNIPQGQWERYLDDIAVTIHDTEGNLSNLSLKVLAGGGTYLLAKATLPVITKVGSKFAASLAGKATAKMAAKTGGTVAGQFGAQFIDPIVAIGIVIWDVWDYHHTVKVERPILREAILDYFGEVKASLLENPNNGIMAAIDELENGILQSLRTSPRAA